MEEVFVPIALFSVAPVIVWIVSHFGARKRATIHETLRLAIEKGQELSPEMMEKMSLLTDPVRADLRKGVLFLAIGAAFGFLGWMVGFEEGEAIMPMIGVASFPVFIGLAYLGLWLGSRGKSA